jgi:curved DNA-binding protein CbpA
MLPDYYSILAVRPNASPEEIRAAYRRRAKQHHPDVGGDSVTFRAVQEAYDALSDPARRRDYDARRLETRPTRNVRVKSRVEPLRHTDPEIPGPLRQPEPLIPSEALRPRRSAPGFSGSLDDLDRLFREFDEFFDRLEVQFRRPSWGRNE